MENNNQITVSVSEYRELLKNAASYAMLADVLKTGAELNYRGGLTLNTNTAEVIMKYVLGDAYQATIEALKEEEE